MLHNKLAVAGPQFGPITKLTPQSLGRAASKDTFLEALLNVSEKHRRNPLDWLVSVALHVIVIAALIVVPFYIAPSLDLHQFQLTYLVAPAPPPAVAPPAPTIQKVVRAVHPLRASQITMPAAIPKHIVIEKDEPTPQPEIGGVIGGVPGGSMEGVLGGIISGAAPPEPPKPAVSKPAAQTPSIVHVGGNVKEPTRIFYVQPEYPILARQARIQGSVTVDAIIDEHGNVVQVHAVDGPALLIQPALKAVMQWKYEPTQLNGVPVALDLHVFVSFSFGGD